MKLRNWIARLICLAIDHDWPEYKSGQSPIQTCRTCGATRDIYGRN